MCESSSCVDASFHRNVWPCPPQSESYRNEHFISPLTFVSKRAVENGREATSYMFPPTTESATVVASYSMQIVCGNISSRRIDLPYPVHRPYQPDFERKSCETNHFLHLGLSKMEDTAPQLVAILIRNMLRIRECFPLNFQAPNPSAVEVCPLWVRAAAAFHTETAIGGTLKLGTAVTCHQTCHQTLPFPNETRAAWMLTCWTHSIIFMHIPSGNFTLVMENRP